MPKRNNRQHTLGGERMKQHRQAEVEAIKKQEATMEVTQQVREARKKAYEQCGTCWSGICTSKCLTK